MNETDPAGTDPADSKSSTGHVVLLGATGTIGQATFKVLLNAGWRVTCFGRRPPPQSQATALADRGDLAAGRSSATSDARGDFIACNFENEANVRTALQGLAPVDANGSLLAPHPGGPTAAHGLDHPPHLHSLSATSDAWIRPVGLLSRGGVGPIVDRMLKTR